MQRAANTQAMQASPLRLGAIASLTTLGIAALIGVVAVLDADHVTVGFGTGLGVALITFVAGATLACALSCLGRRRIEIVALVSILAAGLALDLIVLAVWREIDSEAYTKSAAVAFAWSFFALIILGLTLAIGAPARLARSLYFAAVAAATGAGLITTWLIATAGGASGGVGVGGEVLGVPVAAVGNDQLLRALGVAFVLLAALWFAALAAHRLEPDEA